MSFSVASRPPLCVDVSMRPITMGDKSLLAGAAIIFATAVATTITFAAIALGPAIGGTTLTIPVLFCSTTGAASLVVFSIHCFRRRWAIMSPLQKIARLAFFVRDLQLQPKMHQDKIQAERFQTRDNISLSGLWSSSSLSPSGTYVVILFHGNGTNASEQCCQWKDFYNDLGLDVLAVEIRGYDRQPIGSCESGELGVYLDAEAALNWVVNHKGYRQENVVVHGTSLGGAYATSLGFYHNVAGVILDHTFTSASEVAGHLVPALGRLFSAFAFPKGHSINQAYDPQNQWIQPKRPLVTDGLDNVRKVKGMRSALLIIQGNKDRLMPQRFGLDLQQAQINNSTLINMPGGHGLCCFTHVDDKVQTGLKCFLKKLFLLKEESENEGSSELDVED